MAHTRRQVLLVFILPLVAAIGVTWLLELRYSAARSADAAPVAATRESDQAVDLLGARNPLAGSAVPAPLDAALAPWMLSTEALAGKRFEGGAPDQSVPIPEPRSGLLLALGLTGLAARSRSLSRA
jgi:hypothetical protein